MNGRRLTNPYDFWFPLLRLDAADAAWLAAARPIIERGIDDILDGLYRRLLENPDIRSIFRTEDQVRHAKAKQRRHILDQVLGARQGEDRIAASRRIGDVHRALGVRPNYYIAAYGYLLERFTTLLSASKIDRPGEAATMISVVQRALLEDLDMGISAYVHAVDDGASELLGQARAKSAFLLGMSHDLRTPLNAILGFSELMSDEKTTRDVETYRNYSRIIHESAAHLIDVIDDILVLARAEAGTLALKEEQVRVSQEIDWIVTMQQDAADRQGIRLEVVPTAHATPVRGDRIKLRRVVLNLLSNAIKFTPQGGHVTIREEYPDAGGMNIIVSDDGVGIPAADMERIAEPFFRGSSRAARERAGTGLGLAIVKSIVGLHGGNLRIESEEGKGTTATVHLPQDRLLAA